MEATTTAAVVGEASSARVASKGLLNRLFPPVVVFRTSDNAYLLAADLHRLLTRRMAKFEQIDAGVRQGTRLDALRYSLSANHQHGSQEPVRIGAVPSSLPFGNLLNGAIGQLPICAASAVLRSSPPAWSPRSSRAVTVVEKRCSDPFPCWHAIQAKPSVDQDGVGAVAGHPAHWRSRSGLVAPS